MLTEQISEADDIYRWQLKNLAPDVEPRRRSAQHRNNKHILFNDTANAGPYLLYRTFLWPTNELEHFRLSCCGFDGSSYFSFLKLFSQLQNSLQCSVKRIVEYKRMLFYSINRKTLRFLIKSNSQKLFVNIKPLNFWAGEAKLSSLKLAKREDTLC